MSVWTAGTRNLECHCCAIDMMIETTEIMSVSKATKRPFAQMGHIRVGWELGVETGRASVFENS